MIYRNYHYVYKTHSMRLSEQMYVSMKRNYEGICKIKAIKMKNQENEI